MWKIYGNRGKIASLVREILLLLSSAKGKKAFKTVERSERKTTSLWHTLSWALCNTLTTNIYFERSLWKVSKQCKVSRRKGYKAYKLSLNWKIEKRKPLERGWVDDWYQEIFKNKRTFGKYEKELCNNLLPRCRKYCGDFFSFNCDRRGKSFGEIINGEFVWKYRWVISSSLLHPYFCFPTAWHGLEHR